MQSLQKAGVYRKLNTTFISIKGTSDTHRNHIRSRRSINHEGITSGKKQRVWTRLNRCLGELIGLRYCASFVAPALLQFLFKQRARYLRGGIKIGNYDRFENKYRMHNTCGIETVLQINTEFD